MTAAQTKADPKTAETVAKVQEVFAGTVAGRLKLRLRSSRAPYTRAGIDFASTREPVLIGFDEVTDEQVRRLVGDVAISFGVTDPVTGVSADLPRDLITAGLDTSEAVQDKAGEFAAIMEGVVVTAETAEKAQADADKKAKAEAAKAVKAEKAGKTEGGDA